jgi:nucleotide-binding universal stress UspA family protein
MTALAQRSPHASDVWSAPTVASVKAPIVVAVDGSATSLTAAEAATELARATGGPLLFVYVRRRPSSIWGTPVYQRRLSRELGRARHVLDHALRIAADAGVGADADAEIVEGSPRRRIVDFAAARGARLIVVGSRRRRFNRSVSAAVARAAERPVVVGARATRERRCDTTRAASISGAS